MTTSTKNHKAKLGALDDEELYSTGKSPAEQPKEEKKVKEEPKGTKRKNATFYVSEETVELLERAAYWDRKAKGVILEEAVAATLKGKNYDPIPGK